MKLLTIFTDLKSDELWRDFADKFSTSSEEPMQRTNNGAFYARFIVVIDAQHYHFNEGYFIHRMLGLLLLKLYASNNLIKAIGSLG
jgi:hypothetical protein